MSSLQSKRYYTIDSDSYVVKVQQNEQSSIWSNEFCQFSLLHVQKYAETLNITLS